MEWFVVSTIIALVIVAIVSISVNAYYYTDNGIITSKQYKASWTEMRSVNNGSHYTTVPIHHPERWTIKIINGKNYAYFNISETMYDNLKVGDEFDATEMGVSRQ